MRNTEYTIYLRDTDPDTGEITQVKELATTKTEDLAKDLIKAIYRSEMDGTSYIETFGGDPNREYYYE